MLAKVDLVHTDFLKETKRILKDVVKTGNFDAGFDFINKINEMGEAFSSAKSIMFEGMDKAWRPEKHEGETFLQAAVRKTGLSPVTIVRHTKNQKLLASGDIPEEFRESIENAGEKSLIQISNLWERDVEITKKDWLKLSEAVGDERKVAKIVRDIKGVAPRSNFYAITIDERGTLVGHTKDEHVELGKLNVFSDNQAVQKGINRLTSCSGVQPSVDY